MKLAFPLILCLASLVLAGGPPYDFLGSFVQNNKRIPNRCVSKGETFKCVGYEGYDGVIANVNTSRLYLFSQDGDVEIYREDLCQEFYVQDDNDNEIIMCTEGESLYEARCNTSHQTVEIQEYDELGILKNKRIYEDADPAFCRNAFHFQYGNKGVTRYSHIFANNPPEPERSIGLVVEKGNRDSASIMKVVHKHTPELQRIYKKYQRRKAKFGGEVVLRMTIAPNGEVIKLSMISSTTGNDSFDDEVKIAVYRWLFGRARVSNTTVTLPITFGE